MANSKKRRGGDALGWDDYFMGIAFLSGKRSRDPRTRVGACIVNERKQICGTGYSGIPDGYGYDEKQKHLYECHAEMKAILNKTSADVRGCTIYTSLFPCNECAKIIIQAGIEEVVFYSDKKKGDPKYQAAKEMFRLAKVDIRKSKAKRLINIDFTENDSDEKDADSSDEASDDSSDDSSDSPKRKRKDQKSKISKKRKIKK